MPFWTKSKTSKTSKTSTTSNTASLPPLPSLPPSLASLSSSPSTTPYTTTHVPGEYPTDPYAHIYATINMPSPPAFTSNKTCTRDPVAVNVQLANRVDPFAAVRASVEGPGPYAAIRAAVDREPAPLTHFKAALARSRR